MHKKIILLSGTKGSGKTTAANFILEHFKDLNIQTYSFADIPKDLIHTIFKLDNETSNNLKRREDLKLFGGLSLRELYERFSEYQKHYFTNYVWADFVYEEILKNYDKSDYHLITDLRFKEEFESINNIKNIYKSTSIFPISLYNSNIEDTNYLGKNLNISFKYNIDVDNTDTLKEEILYIFNLIKEHNAGI